MHRGVVGMGYDPERNCGCIVGALVAAPFAWLWLVGNALGGFGCEGAEQPCKAHTGTFWLGVVVLAGGALAVAWAANALIRWLRDKRG